jgi:hypothetical protein
MRILQQHWSAARRITAPWSAGALVATLVAGVSCAPGPEQRRAERTVDAEYDVETGRLELITFDSDDNGTIGPMGVLPSGSDTRKGGILQVRWWGG